MYTVMIIDDDKNMRERLRTMIDWCNLGVELLCEASDSETATELYERFHPNIIVTDIRIPFISGLELARRFIRIDPTLRVIAITGYNDFEYVQKSVSLGAIDLLAKPLEFKEVNASLRKAIDSLKAIKQAQLEKSAVEHLVEANLPMLQEKYISYLLRHHDVPPEEISAQLSLLSLKFDANTYVAVRILVCSRQKTRQEQELLAVSAKNIGNELFKNSGFQYFSFYDDAYELICVLAGETLTDDSVAVVIDQLRHFMEDHFQADVLAGIGGCVSSLSDLYISMEQANTAMAYLKSNAETEVIDYASMTRIAAPVDSHLHAQLAEDFKKNRAAHCDALIDRFFDSLPKPYDLDHIRRFFFQCAATAMASAFTLGLHAEDGSRLSGVYLKLASFSDPEAHRNCLKQFFQELSSAVFQTQTHNRNGLIEKSKKFVVEHLSDPSLDLEMVSSHLGLSRIYFSRLFSKTEDLSFNQYVNQIRIQYAQELLLQTPLKVYEISDAVGYNDPKHFNYVFRRNVGMSPLKYRNTYGIGQTSGTVG